MRPEASGMLYTTVACMQSTAAAKAYLGVEFQRHWWPELHALTLPFSLRRFTPRYHSVDVLRDASIRLQYHVDRIMPRTFTAATGGELDCQYCNS